MSEEEVRAFFDRLQVTLDGIPPRNIINYDETNITDDPKGKLMIFRKGAKRAEIIMNTTKSSTSLKFAGTATGEILDPYVVFKAERLQDTWIYGGPLNAHYNRTTSGWFDSHTFIDWFKKVLLKFCDTKLPRDEPKLVIGDNLSSHLSFEIANLAENHNICLVFLPPNSTGLLQPLDVGVYAPLKKV